jgi:hypothetical protein
MPSPRNLPQFKPSFAATAIKKNTMNMINVKKASSTLSQSSRNSTSKFLAKCRQYFKAMTETWEKQLYAKIKYEFHLSDHISNFITEYQAEERKFYSLKDSLQKKKLKLYSKQMSEWGLNEEKVAKFLN